LKEVIFASSYLHRSPLINATLSHYKMKPYYCISQKGQCNKYFWKYFCKFLSKFEWDDYQLPTYLLPTFHLHLPTSTKFLPTNKWPSNPLKLWRPMEGNVSPSKVSDQANLVSRKAYITCQRVKHTNEPTKVLRTLR
jgi:hypothetical protein